MIEYSAGQGASNLVALLALLFSFGVTAMAHFREKEVRAREMRVEERETRAEERDTRVEKSTAYLQLEVHSSEAFRYAAEHCEAMRPYEAPEKPARLPRGDRQDAEKARQYYFQCLNLFEVCSNFRRAGVIEKQVYASWVAWFHEVLDQWYFRELWVAEMRENYTDDVRHIFDVGLQIYAAIPGEEERRREFYRSVAHLMGGCQVIRDWPEHVKRPVSWPPAEEAKADG